MGFIYTDHVSDPNYEYVDDSTGFPAVKFKAASGNVIINHGIGDGEMYHETVLYHSVGPSTSRARAASKAEANIYEDDVLYQLPEAGQPSRSIGNVYEAPALIQVFKPVYTFVIVD